MLSGASHSPSSFHFGNTLASSAWGEVPLGHAAEMDQQQRMLQVEGSMTTHHSRRRHHHRDKPPHNSKKNPRGTLPPLHSVTSNGSSVSLSLLESEIKHQELVLTSLLKRRIPSGCHPSAASTSGASAATTENTQQTSALLSAVSKEVLLARGIDGRLPGRFLAPLKQRVETEREDRQRKLQQWWEHSMVDISTRIAQSMPLCRMAPDDEADTVAERDGIPVESDNKSVIDTASTTTTIAAGDGDMQTTTTTAAAATEASSHLVDDVAPSPVLPVVLTPPLSRSKPSSWKFTAALSLLSGHPSLQSDVQRLRDVAQDLVLARDEGMRQ